MRRNDRSIAEKYPDKSFFQISRMDNYDGSVLRGMIWGGMSVILMLFIFAFTTHVYGYEASNNWPIFHIYLGLWVLLSCILSIIIEKIKTKE